MATTRSAATMATPTRAVALRRRRRSAWASGDSERAAREGQLTSVTAGSSASRRLPPLMGRGFTVPSGITDPGIEERVRQIDDEIDHDERERGEQREPLHLLIVARDDRVDAEG